MRAPGYAVRVHAGGRFGLTVPRGALCVETVRFRDGDNQRRVVGEILVEAQDGGLMLLAEDGRTWMLQPDRILERHSDVANLEPIDADEMERRVLAELPARP